ncbi:threonine--tRNA ligase [Alkalihalobacillus sp. NPDC078783]
MYMEQLELIFPDGAKKEFPQGSTTEDVAASISPGLKKKAIAGKINGQLIDLKRPIPESGEVAIITPESDEALEILRHSTAHLMAQAVRRLFKNVKLGVGPVIEDGFYYDIDSEESITQEDLPKIEKEMKKIVSENLEIHRLEVSREEAKVKFGEDEYKQELLEAIPAGEQVTIYEQGEFFDLCRGIHVPSTNKIKAFKLQNLAGAYWRGNSDNKMLQRIYGTAFFKQADLDEHLELLRQAKERDHRKLGRELELFMFSEEAPGMPFFLPNGQTIRTELENFSRNLYTKAGYQEVRTPLMMNQRLWEQSGHWDHYHENMYFSDVDDKRFALKPMNCPGHMLIYKNAQHSYRDLPIRMAEFGQVHRHELSGSLNGMLRVRTFTQDDAHIFVAPNQIEDELKQVFGLVDQIYSTFGFEYSVELSTRPEDSMGADELWEQAEQSLENVLKDLNVDYILNEGDGAFYGPKIDFHIKDALKRSHQCATIQLDFQMPEKFDLTYVNEQGEKDRPIVIHRAVFGSIDRFIAILIEHFGGAFPTWLAPVQVQVIPVSPEAHLEYAQEVKSLFEGMGVRVQLDERNEKIGYKIREAQMKKIPYMLVLGDKEVADGTVNVRKYSEQDQQVVDKDAFLAQVVEEISTHRL